MRNRHIVAWGIFAIIACQTGHGWCVEPATGSVYGRLVADETLRSEAKAPGDKSGNSPPTWRINEHDQGLSHIFIQLRRLVEVEDESQNRFDPKVVRKSVEQAFHKRNGFELSELPKRFAESDDRGRILFPTTTIECRNKRFSPVVLLLREGEPLVIKNADSKGYAIALRGRHGINRKDDLMGANTAIVHWLKAEDYLSIVCHIHPWLQAEVLVTNNPLTTVSDESGRFRLWGVPAGTYKIRGWGMLRTVKVPVTDGVIEVGNKQSVDLGDLVIKLQSTN